MEQTNKFSTMPTVKTSRNDSELVLTGACKPS